MDMDGEDLPAVDERLVAPGSRYEIIDGLVTYVPPALPPHALRHSKVSALVEAHAHADYQVASDMLTRTSRIDDLAPDVSVYARAPHPSNGGRQLEVLAFQVMASESPGRATTKARKLSERGVRRVFAIDVTRNRALEWSRELGTWSVLDVDGSIADPALAVALPIDALLNAANTDEPVARALLAKRVPVLEAARAADRLTERRDSVIEILRARGIAIDPEQRTRLEAEVDPARVGRWISVAATCTNAGELFGV
ncbi:MAG: Uma2 family endonuclease [Kofleriaceae bacterium]